MGNDVSKEVFGSAVEVTDVASLAKRASAAAQNTPRGSAPAGSDYLNFSGKRGVFIIGEDKRQIDEDELWVVDIRSFEEGYVCWKGGSPVSSRMSNIYSGVPVQQPDPDELGPFDSSKGEGWFQAKALIMRSCDNEQQGYFKINSVSGVATMSELMGEFAERAAQTAAYWPVVSLRAEEFDSQGYKNFKPMFDIEGWLTVEQCVELSKGADIEALIEGEAESAPEPEPEPETPKGRGRRRRKAA